MASHYSALYSSAGSWDLPRFVMERRRRDLQYGSSGKVLPDPAPGPAGASPGCMRNIHSSALGKTILHIYSAIETK